MKISKHRGAGTMRTEKAKIDCAKKLFNEMSTNNVRYHEVTDYETMLNEINALK